MIVDTDQLLEVAWQGASAAGQLIQESWQKPKSIEYKGAIDLVTSVDRESERIIIAAIQHYFPDHSIVGEEETIVHGADQNAAGSLIHWTARRILHTVIPSSASPSHSKIAA